MDNFKSDYSPSWIVQVYFQPGGYGKPHADHMDRQRMHTIFNHLLDDGLTTEATRKVKNWLINNPIPQP